MHCLRNNSKVSGTMDVHVLDTDTDNGSLKSDFESNDFSAITPTVPCTDVGIAKDEMMLLLKQIRDAQSSTRTDLHKYSCTISKKFDEVDHRVATNTSSIKSVASRLTKIETSLELNKQNAVSCNLSIIGIPWADCEDLVSIAIKLFPLAGMTYLAVIVLKMATSPRISWW